MLDLDSDEVTPMSQVLFDLYSKLHEISDRELMKLTEEELRIMQIVYRKELVYPIHEHIDQLLSGATNGDTVH